MIKLWQRSSIAKIAIKRGVQLTTSERMAEDIKVIKECFGVILNAINKKVVSMPCLLVGILPSYTCYLLSSCTLFGPTGLMDSC